MVGPFLSHLCIPLGRRAELARFAGRLHHPKGLTVSGYGGACAGVPRGDHPKGLRVGGYGGACAGVPRGDHPQGLTWVVGATDIYIL